MSEQTLSEETQIDPILDADISKREEPSSLYKQVMENPESRRVFFELGQMSGVLSGSPHDEDLPAVRQALKEAIIPYIYSANKHRPRLEFRIEDKIRVGREAIEAYIATQNEN